MIEFMDKHAGFAMFLVTLILVGVTIFYVIFTKRIAHQTKRQVDLLLVANKATLHRELCEKVYMKVKDWLLPLTDVKSYFDSYLDYGIAAWDEFKGRLPYQVYQLDKEFLDKIVNLNMRVNNFIFEQMNYKPRLEIEALVKNVFVRGVLDNKEDRIKKVLIKSLKGVNKAEGASNHDFVEFFCIDELVEGLLKRCKDGGKVYWNLIDIGRGEQGFFLTEVFDGNGFELNCHTLESKVNEINRLISEHGRMNSWVQLVKSIVKDANLLVSEIETELARSDKSIAKKYLDISGNNLFRKG